MGKYEPRRENAEVEKAFRQVTKSSSAPGKTGGNKKKPASQRAAEQRRKMIILICVCVGVLALLIGLIIGLVAYSNRSTDDGRILSNVYAGDVNLGGMTLDEAKSALHLATDYTFTKKDMVITLPDTTITLPPADTKARLDVDAVAQAAYDYGRGGSNTDFRQAQEDAESTSYHIALLPYLQLDLSYIEQTIETFCSSYSSVMTEPVITIEGDRPAFDPEYPDLEVMHQTLTIVMGTPSYNLVAKDIYGLVLDAYSLNQLEVSYEPATPQEPETPDALALFEAYCVPAQNATMDPETMEVTPEIYGYGFDIPEIQQKIDNAAYGEIIEIKLGFLTPEITEGNLTEDMYKDILAEYEATSPENDENRSKNLQKSCEAINNYIIKAGEEFSFNELIGRLSVRNGYSNAPVSAFNGSAMGGGVSQTASALYYCALLANLDIVERHSHEYTVEFAELGLDALVDDDQHDLRFRNNTSSPIRIVAIADGNGVKIQLIGVNELNYDVKLSHEIVKQHAPETTFQNMAEDNVKGHKDGDILETGIIGYDVKVLMEKYDKESGELLSSLEVSSSKYSKRDEVKVRIEGITPDPAPEDPTESTDSTESTDPAESTDLTTEVPAEQAA